MKKLIYTSIAVMFSAITFAQFTYGPKLGVNGARFTNDKIMPGFQFGAFLNSEIYDGIGIQADFLWALKGNKHESSDSISSTNKNLITTKTYYRFVEIPICLYFPISKHIRGFIGPQVNIYRKGHQTVEYKGKSIESNVSGTGDLSLIMGFDFKLDSPITLGLRFVANNFSKSGAVSTEEVPMKLNTFELNIGYTMDW